MTRVALVSMGLLLVLASAACKAQLVNRSQSADWRVTSVSAWVEKNFMGGAPHPTGGQTGTLVGDYHAADKRALFVEVAFRALRADPAALAAFKTVLASDVPPDKIPTPRDGQYRLFDSVGVTLRPTTTGSLQPPDAIATLAQTTVVKRSNEDFAQVGEAAAPAGLANSYLFSFDHFVALARAGEDALVRLVYEVPESFDRTKAELSFYDQKVTLPDLKQPAQPSSFSVIWHLEGWNVPAKQKH